ncbi:di/tricarboxylate transporter [Streptococcus rupicaprae]|uniref:Di/tricarboxylate transporter n=1 Tax=Streptococcus rupicaprae TaxID=759619 RepID=A0ABV2FJX0_9STRE
MKKFKYPHLLTIVGFVTLLMLWNPLAFDWKQNALVSSLLAVLAFWATDALHKTLACVILLAAFLCFGQTPAQEIFAFAWSPTNLLIITTTLFSVGLMHSGLAHALIGKVMLPFTRNRLFFMLFPYLLGLLLVFVIPQGFARVIVVGTLLDNLLQTRTAEEESGKAILLFNAFLGVTLTYMFFPNGEIVLNQAALGLAGPEISSQLDFGTWFSLMSLPTVITIIAVLILQECLFKKSLKGVNLARLVSDQITPKTGDRSQLLWTAISTVGLLLVWQTEGWHGLPAWLVTAVVVLIFFWRGILKPSDIKQINPHFLLFLLTIFSIGKVLGQSGVTGIVFEKLQGLLPDPQSSLYLLVIILLVMGMHLSIGSAVATMSVVLPLLFPLMATAGYQGVIVLLMVYVLVNSHFLLPFHHATMMIGIGKSYYSERTLFRFGLAMTVLTPILVLVVYFGWWRLLGWV